MSPELFIRRPVLTTLLMAAILLFGIMGFRLLPVSDLPNVDFPTIQVSASLPGASPETMASAVATPLEKQFTTIAGIDSMTSSSAIGLTQITLQFSLERNIDAAAQDVQAMITKAAPLLPPSMPTPPTYQKVNPADQPVIFAYRNGSPVRLEELGRVVDGVQTDKVASWYNDERAVILAIQRQPGTNSVEVVDAVRALLPRFRQELPASVNLNVLYDRSVAIRESVHDVEFTLALAIALVVMVIFLFLRNLSATIIPSLAVPLSIVGTFAVMYLLGYTIDIISLMALTLCVGFVVDDAVVMLENIIRHMEEGMNRREAALIGAKEIGFTIMSMTLSLAAVFIPVLFMGGVMGRLLHEFAVVITAAVLVSGFVSLTLTPMACSRFLRPPGESHGRLYLASERFFDGMLHVYDQSLQWTLRHRRLTMAVMLATFVLTGYLFAIIPKGFIPTEDTGQIFAFTEAAQDISFDAMVDKQRAAAAIVLKQPYIDQIMSSIGASTINVVPNTGHIFIQLKR